MCRLRSENLNIANMNLYAIAAVAELIIRIAVALCDRCRIPTSRVLSREYTGFGAVSDILW